MNETGPVKKISISYLILYTLVIAAITITGMLVSISLGSGSMAAAAIIVTMVFLLLWCYLGGKWMYEKKRKEMLKQLEASGFVNNHTVNGSSAAVAVDQVHKKIALIFRWNTFQSYILPASKITKTWVDDGRSGKGLLEGSSYVRFGFLIDGIKVSIYTFSSNQRFSMDSDHIQTGVSKADMMVEILNEASMQEV